MPGVKTYLLEQAGPYLDYVSVHNYWLDRGKSLPKNSYAIAIVKSEMPGAYMTIVADSLRDAGMGRLKIAFDEWNLRAWQHPGFPRNKVKNYDAPEIREFVELRRKQNDVAEQYTMADALFTASFFNACLRHSEVVTMANVAPLVNTRGPLFVHPKGIVKRTHFHAMAMYANKLEKRIGKVKVEAGKFSHDSTSVDVVDAIATVDPTGRRWAISLVNRHPTDRVDCKLMMNGKPLDGTYKATILKGKSADSYNDIAHPNRVQPKEVSLVIRNGVANLPAHSLVIVNVAR